MQITGSKSKCSLIRLALALMVLVPLIVSCAAKIDESQTYERNGLVYRIGANTPFTGFVKGEAQREGYRRKPCRFVKAYKNGLLEGRSFFYFLNGKVESVEPYEKGLINGVVTRYYENGQIKARIHFVDGLRGGTKGEMFWNEDGSRRSG